MGGRTLVVDDDAIMRLFLKRTLGSDGYEVKLASNGVDALNIITSSTFDHMITDMNMPMMDGVSLIKEIKRSRIYPQHHRMHRAAKRRISGEPMDRRHPVSAKALQTRTT